MESLAARLMLHRTTHPTTLALAGIRAGTMAAAAIVAVDAEMVVGVAAGVAEATAGEAATYPLTTCPATN